MLRSSADLQTDALLTILPSHPDTSVFSALRSGHNASLALTVVVVILDSDGEVVP